MAEGASAKRLAWTVVVIGIFIAILGSAFFLLRSRAENSLSGDWIARMHQSGQAAYTLRLHLEVSGGTLTGNVGGVPIVDGVLNKGSLNFSSGNTKYHGDLRGRSIDLVATNPEGITTTGLARKAE